ncbi:MarR family winged helix-turn-helix transcriptional regulator [Granulicella sp. L46]|uniref:MarR family winged helix-turn-helix transcriptional regulator n=1 Tax=Granulicella sp. L46 TaxID=1641865 RepID=UPI00131AD4EC|nr:MarR family winged helix-turn-helix transcriptional regulator [Granulicella sp. L46]
MKTAETRPPSNLHSHIGFWLRYVSNHVSHAFAQKLLDSGVTVAEWVILREMFDRDGTAPSDLAELTGLTRGAISKLADRLIAKQLLARTHARDDRRYQTLALTTAGRILVPTLANLADENDEQFFAALSPKQRKRLLNTLKKLVQANHLSTLPTE